MNNINNEDTHISIQDSIFNMKLSPMELTVYTAIVSIINTTSGYAVVKYSTIAERASVSRHSVCRALRTLCEKNLITRLGRYRPEDGHRVSNSYKVTHLCSKTFTQIPNDIWNYHLSPEAFAIFLYLSSESNYITGFSFPSYTEIKGKTNMTTSTIAKHLEELEDAHLIHKYYYIEKNGGFGHNNYRVLYTVKTKEKNPHSDKYNVVIVKAGNKEFKVISFYTNRLKIEFEFRVLKQIA